MAIIHKGLKNMSKMVFAKILLKLNYILSTISESLNLNFRLNHDFKEEIKLELPFLNEIENQNLLQD